MREIIGNIIQADKLFKLFKKNDSIAIAISGGKDSLLMALALKIYTDKLNSTSNYNIRIKGFMVDLGFKKKSFSRLHTFFKKHNIAFEIIDSNIAQILISKKEKNMIQCSLCSRMKKAILIKTIKQQGFNKIAFGHHADDAIETLFLNMFNEGRIAIFNPLVDLDRNGIILIRPLILIREKQIIKISKKLQLPVLKGLCPNDRITQRTYIKKFLDSKIYENKAIWPNSYTNVYRSFLNKKQFNLWFDKLNK